MSRAPDFELDPDEIVDAAIEIFREGGLDAVSMRSVSGRLGVSPVPLYSRIGNREALIDAVGDRLLADLAPPSTPGEPWSDYALRWARQLRARLGDARDSRLIVRSGRAAYVEASRPLVAAMRADGFARDDAVHACRLLTWATVGFGAVESGAKPATRQRARPRTRPGGDADGVDAAEIDELFELHLRYLIEGIAGDRRDAPRDTERTRGKAKRR